MFASELQPANPVAVAALRFLMFTGWREREALTLKWGDVSLKTGIATLGDTKTGKSVRTIGAPALELLAAQPRVQGSPYVFFGREPEKPLREIQRPWYAARSEARLEDVQLHDLRHSVACFAGGRGYSLFLFGRLLGHKGTRSTGRYAHLADDIRKTMADDVGEVIREAMASDPETVASRQTRSPNPALGSSPTVADSPSRPDARLRRLSAPSAAVFPVTFPGDILNTHRQTPNNPEVPSERNISAACTRRGRFG